MKSASLRAYSISDLRELARRRLPKGLFEFVDRGAEDEVTLRGNREAIERIKLKPRVLSDVSQRSQEIMLFGKLQKMPIAVAPTGAAGILWHEGEIALARAAAAAGIPFTLATASMTAMEKIPEQAGGTLWFQLYMYADRSLSHGLARRAAALGYEALLVTVDSPVFANREYNLRNGFTIPLSFTLRNTLDVLSHPRWLSSVLLRYVLTTGLPLYANYPDEVRKRITAQPMGRALRLNDSLTWDDVRALRELWPGKLMLKGVLHPQDAATAARHGVDAVIVSNHGGRTVDGAIAPIEVLPDIVEAAGGRMTVIVDSGFRRGSDVIKALAVGAKAVLIGRSTLYGVAADGAPGAARALAIFRDEIERVLALLGCRTIAELNREYVALPEGMRESKAASRTAELRLIGSEK